MTEAAARQQISAKTQAAVEPTLSATEINTLLEMHTFGSEQAKRFDVNAAAAEGWRWKAAKVAHRHTVTIDGQVFAAGQIFEHCEKMAAMYGKKRTATINTGRG